MLWHGYKVIIKILQAAGALTSALIKIKYIIHELNRFKHTRYCFVYPQLILFFKKLLILALNFTLIRVHLKYLPRMQVNLIFERQKSKARTRISLEAYLLL